MSIKAVYILIFSFVLFNGYCYADEGMDESFLEEFEQESVESYDPLEGYNRMMFAFNDRAYVYLINPVSKTYSILSKNVRLGIANVFDNLFYPVRVVNNLLQGKIAHSYEETKRFLINSSIGVLGVFDIASSEFNISRHHEDFGQTLGYWGVGAGPHIVLPLLGPSNFRDALSTLGDYYLDLNVRLGNLEYKIPHNFLEESSIYVVKTINKNSLFIGLYDSFKKDSVDFYTFSRDFYERKRINDIKE